MTASGAWGGLIAHYREGLPIRPGDRVVTLNGGNTPLVRADRLASAVAPGIELYLKVDGENPTGSFKDRGMTVAVTRAVSEGAEAIICASTGNTSASAAAYAARAGIRAYVLVPQGKIALGKLSQAVMHGARVIQIDGNFDQALALVRDVKERYPTRLALVNSVNPDRVEGQKTASFVLLARSVRRMVGISAAAGLLAALPGFALSIPYDLPTGPAMIAISGVLVVLAWLVRRYVLHWR